MSNQTASPITENTRKKPILKRWWFWTLTAIFVVIVIGMLSSGGSSTSYELSKLQTMGKQQIIDKFGNPDEVVRDDADGYIYAYNAGFMVRGAQSGALEITLQNDMVKQSTSDTYKLFDVMLGSSFDENVTRLGVPNLAQSQNGSKNALYLTKEDYLLLLSTNANSDKIARIQYVIYNGSAEAMNLDLSKFLGLSATEEEISTLYSIKEKSSSQGKIQYVFDGFAMIVDEKNHLVKQLFIAEDSIYNVHGIRIRDSLERANQTLGTPVSTRDGVKNTTQYTYRYEGAPNNMEVHLSVDNSTNKIGFIEVTLQ